MRVMTMSAAALRATRPEPALDSQAQKALEGVRVMPQYVGENENGVRLVCISDTHGTHSRLSLPDGDILVHAGDFTVHGTTTELDDFAEWFSSRPHRHKVVVAGNHDLALDAENDRGDDEAKARFISTIRECGGHYLENEATNIAGLWFYGSPRQPYYGEGWAFQYERGEAAVNTWKAVPENIDVLITHGPAFGRNDLCISGKRAGCVDLLHEIQQRIRPKVHIFGHIHEDPGASSDGTTDFINASSVNIEYRGWRPPIIVTLSP